MSITFAPAVVTALGDESVTHVLTAEGVNVNDRNGADLLTLLGLDFDGDYGETAAEDFLGRVLLAQALLDVATDDEHGRFAAREARWTECGRRPGHLAERLTELHEVALQAIERDAVISWS
ncbi:hypothetical protein [Phytohabitans houttuyneae]|uniref:Uncharacterized protein n=1 Tax=Phytohabitans houttuyneae TaxID=1076126 RepID=A0A6V8K2S5_9ACTN|nr:hypothetical protein [Phytohabitans houttuyneae]GFJ79433.1 hypothetical protein Phou_036130 [Phytohabitans houttuyneae]